MVNITCEPELRQEIYDWIVEETDKVREDPERDSWIGVGVDTYYLHPTIVDAGVEIECGEDDAEEIYYKHFPVSPDEWILDFFKKMKRQFPTIEMSGTFGVFDKYGTNYYGVKVSANDTEVDFKSMYQCAVCGKLTDEPYEVDSEDNDYSECICSPECAGECGEKDEDDE